MYYLTVGYPLGMEIVEERQVYQISLRSKTVNLIPLEYRIWSKFLLGAYENDVKKTLSDADLNGFVPTMNKLIQTKMLIALPEGDYSGMRDLKFLRQGIGIGLDLNENAYYVLFREKIRLTPTEYDIWKEADSAITYGELERRVILRRQLHSSEIQKTVIGLCRRGILLAVNYEER